MENTWRWGAEPKRKGSEGFNDAGILTFNSHAINSFVRELFQNSNDAKVKGEKKIKIKIERSSISNKIFQDLMSIFQFFKELKHRIPNMENFSKKLMSL